MRAGGLPCDRLPLDPGGEGCAAAPDELGVLHLAQHALGPELERAAQGCVAAVGAVVVDARRIRDAHAAEEPQRRIARLRQRCRRGRPRLAAGEQVEHRRGRDGRLRSLERLVARNRDERRGCSVALA